MIKSTLRRFVHKLLDATRYEEVMAPVGRAEQILLQHAWRRVPREAGSVPTFPEVEFSTFSQNGEDGILLYLFSLIGTTNRRVVEIGAGDAIECNAANLIVNHGWTGLLIDGSEKNLARGRRFYATRSNAWRFHRLPPTIVSAWITRDNVNELLASHEFAGDIDLLSLDIDGTDYWIWEAITVVKPRVVVVEFNNRWAADRAVTVPYRDAFVDQGNGQFGASLAAFEKLAERKGYRLVGANSPSTNAFFVRREIAPDLLPSVTVESCLSSEFARHQQRTGAAGANAAPLVEV